MNINWSGNYVYIIWMIQLIILLDCINSKGITLQYELFYGKYNFATVIKGKQDLAYSLKIDLSSPYTVVEGLEFDYKDIIEEKKLMSTYYLPIPSVKIEREFQLNHLTIPLHIYNIKDAQYFKILTQSLGLSPKIENEELSLVYKLKNLNYTDKLIFGFEPYLKIINSFYIGDKPHSFSPDYPYYSFCKIKPSYSTWGCLLRKVFFDGYSRENYYSIESYAFFQSNTNEILVPKSFMSYLKETVLQQYIDNKKCIDIKVGMLTDNYGYINCDCEVLAKLPKINFLLGDYIHSFNMSDLFEVSESSINSEFCELIIQPNQQEDIWVFGTSFLGQYYSFFDYDNHLVEFYSKSNTPLFITNESRTIKGIYVIAILIMCINTILLGIEKKGINTM